MNTNIPETHDNASTGQFEPFIQDAGQRIDTTCNQCGAKTYGYENLMKIYKQVTCIKCSDDYDARHGLTQASAIGQHHESLKNTWVEHVGNDFANSDFANAQFKESWEALKSADFDKSIFILGPSGTAKTRTAVAALERKYINKNSVKIMFDIDIRESATINAQKRYGELRALAKFDYLMLDDVFFSGLSDSRIIEWAKSLIDMRERFKRPTIITSQVGSKGMVESSGKWEDASTSQKEALQALIRRMYEKFQVVKTQKIKE